MSVGVSEWVGKKNRGCKTNKTNKAHNRGEKQNVGGQRWTRRTRTVTCEQRVLASSAATCVHCAAGGGVKHARGTGERKVHWSTEVLLTPRITIIQRPFAFCKARHEHVCVCVCVGGYTNLGSLLFREGCKRPWKHGIGAHDLWELQQRLWHRCALDEPSQNLLSGVHTSRRPAVAASDTAATTATGNARCALAAMRGCSWHRLLRRWLCEYGWVEQPSEQRRYVHKNECCAAACLFECAGSGSACVRGAC
jgi:hypothetical protein